LIYGAYVLELTLEAMNRAYLCCLRSVLCQNDLVGALERRRRSSSLIGDRY